MDLSVLLLVVQVFLAFAIIGLILLQKGKGASEGASFGGGGGAGSVFGASGSSNFLSKTTAILATGFFINSLALAYLAGHRDVATSVVDTIEASTESSVVTEQPADVFGGVPLAADAPVESDVPAAADVPPAAE